MRKADDTITVKAEEWTCNELVFPVNKKVSFVCEDLPLDRSHFKSNDILSSVLFDYMLNPSINPISFQNKYFLWVWADMRNVSVPPCLFSLTQSDTDRRSAHLYRRWHLLICPIRFKSTWRWRWHLRFPLDLAMCDILYGMTLSDLL